MVELTLHNTRTRRDERFAPLDPGDVRMYVCGPTVYDRAHLGNARPVVVFDVLYRLLRHVYGESHVTYVRNFTDVDDKINARARELQADGDTRAMVEIIRELTDETVRWYHEDMDALGALRPDREPRATEYIPQMIAMISELVARGCAYEAEGHVLFDVRSFPDYGRLSGRSVDDMIAGARVEVAPYKRDPMDFVLWKPSAADEPGWDSPWGFGRPGWHIECSAMSHELLGATFDIHGGGIDLQFPHHENEVAQSCCAHPEGDFARFWLHNEMVQVEGRKMSKSLGNFFTVRDLLDQGIPGEVIRFVMLGTHYRKPMDWTEKRAQEAKATLQRWADFGEAGPDGDVDPEVLEALSDDLNTPAAIARLNELFKTGKRTSLNASARLLGFDLKAISDRDWAKRYVATEDDDPVSKDGHNFQPTVSVMGWGEISDELRDSCLGLVRRWMAHRRARDWAQADRLRSEAGELGIELRATKSANGVSQGMAQLESTHIDPEKIGSLR
ncbi:cysteine--tRNA ligase [Rhodobacteraceae bacterium WD3A24]|nr:cysteine--tRNA ligase [Rhodobacteraceae bacterium WD3A24]